MINIESSFDPLPVASELIEHAALTALGHQSGDGDITIVLTDDAQMRQLNRDYLRIDEPTNNRG